MIGICLIFGIVFTLFIIPERTWAKIAMQVSFLLKSQYISTKGQQLYWISFQKLADPYGDNKKEYLNQLPDYKFYLALLKKVLKFALERGLSLRPVLGEIKHSFRKDIEFSKRLKVEEKGAIFQFICLAVFVWIFICLSDVNSGLAVSSKLKIGVLSLHLTGVISFFIIIRLAIKYSLKNYDMWINEVIFFQSLVSIGEGIDLSFPEKLFETAKTEPFGLYWKKLNAMKFNALEKGIPMTEELKNLKEDIFFSRELCFQKWKKTIGGLKVLWLFLFFFSSYLLCILAIFGQILQTMG